MRKAIAMTVKSTIQNSGRPLTPSELHRISVAVLALDNLLDDVDLTLYAEQSLIDARDFLSGLIEPIEDEDTSQSDALCAVFAGLVENGGDRDAASQ